MLIFWYQIIYIAHIIRRVLKTVRDNTLLDDKVFHLITYSFFALLCFVHITRFLIG